MHKHVGSGGAWADQTDVGDHAAITVFDDASSSSTLSIPFGNRNSDLTVPGNTVAFCALFWRRRRVFERMWKWNPEEESVLDIFEMEFCGLLRKLDRASFSIENLIFPFDPSRRYRANIFSILIIIFGIRLKKQ